MFTLFVSRKFNVSDDIVKRENCQFMNQLKREKLETWFTVPIQDEHENYGFCAIGYFQYTLYLKWTSPLMNLEKMLQLVYHLRKKRARTEKIKGIEFITKI